MRKPLAVFIALVIAGGWLFAKHYQIDGLQAIRVLPRTQNARTEPPDDAAKTLPVSRTGDAIRVATFNIQVFGDSKLQKPHVMDVLARLVRQFDVVAIQEIRSRNQDIVPQFVDLINATGRQYDYVIGPRQGRTSSEEQYAFIFDRASVEVDRSQLYTINDPNDLLHRPPLVAWFRVRGPEVNEAFTFTLVNVHLDADEVDREMEVMSEVFRSVREDGRGEDDVILLGDFNTDDDHYGQLARMPGMIWALSHTPTNTRGTQMYDNLIFHQVATSEFTGRAGVVDFLRQYNLSMDEALEVSDHLPVWAEFSIYEGGAAGRVAGRDVPSDVR